MPEFACAFAELLSFVWAGVIAVGVINETVAHTMSFALSWS